MQITPPYYHTLVYIFKKISTVGPNGPKLGSWEHTWAYLCKTFSYSHHFWPHDSQWGYKKLINPNDLDWPWMTLKWHKKTFFSQHIPLSITFSAQNCLKMKNLLSYGFEQGTIEYIYKRIGTKSTALLALISYVIVILVGRTCLTIEEKMYMLISNFTKKIIFVLFVPIFLEVSSSKSYESRFFIFTQFWG